MKKEIGLFLLLLAGIQYSYTQSEGLMTRDSLRVNGRLGLLGSLQTGNLNQLSLMPNGFLTISDTNHFAELNLTYHFLRINGFNAKNDFWTYGLYQHKPNLRIFPSIHTIAGFATSFKIDHSIVTGLGGGINLHQKGPANFLQLHLFVAYLNFKYELENMHEAPAIGSLIKGVLPVNKHINFRWELSSFHSLKDEDFWGGGNLLQLIFPIRKNLIANINHQTYYNHEVTTNIKNLNAEMLFGIQYNFSTQN